MYYCLFWTVFFLNRYIWIMRKLILLLLFPAFLFAQDFRKMSFGQSIEELKETYPATEFVEENEMEMVILSHDDMVGGLETTVAYLFVDN